MQQKVEHQAQGDGGVFFIMQDGERVAEMTYWRDGPKAVINHTEVAIALRGRGVARKLVDAAVQWARANQVKLGSTCSYASAIFARDASLRDVLA